MIPVETLKYYPHFSSISNHYLKKIAMISHLRSFEKGERLFREGNTATHLMFLTSGEINVVYLLGDGREVVADTLVAGDTLGMVICVNATSPYGQRNWEQRWLFDSHRSRGSPKSM